MSEYLRVRLEFRLLEKDVKNTLLSFSKNEIKDVKSLEKVIKDRFLLSEEFSLNIDKFVLQETEPIEILRDNDLIVIEPIITAETIVPNIRIKSEPLFDDKKQSMKSKFLTPVKREHNLMEIPLTQKSVKKSTKKSLEYSYDESSKSNACKLTGVGHKPKFRSEKVKAQAQGSKNMRPSTSATLDIGLKGSDINLNQIDVNPNEDSGDVDHFNIYSSRNTPVRKAFRTATTQLKKKAIVQKVDESSDKPKPKRKSKWLSREAREPVDEFSPIIILEKIAIDGPEPQTPQEPVPILLNVEGMKKQSARKSFPLPPALKNNDNIEKTPIIDKPVDEKALFKRMDCNNCQPMAKMPNKGDIIAFKMLTLSKDGISYETTEFKKGSVIDVNPDNGMVDILLADGIRNQRQEYLWKNNSEKNYGIHAIKINWSTIIEPKLIQSSQPVQ